MKQPGNAARLMAVVGPLLVSLVVVLATVRVLAAHRLQTAQSGNVVIDAVLYDGYELSDMDEAVAVRNLGPATVDIGNYVLADGGGSSAIVPAPRLLTPGQAIWLARDAGAFARQFGFLPDVELASWPGFSNAGDEVVLLDSNGLPLDVLVYGDGDTAQPGWSGEAARPYTVSSVFGAEGQILYRLLDQTTGLPRTDTDTASDWAQANRSVIDGRKVRYPGWDLEKYFAPRAITATGTMTIAVAPDNSYEAIVQLIGSATQRIRLASLTLEQLGVAEALAAAAARGVEVTVFLEGGPVGGLSDQGRYACQLIEAAGGACWFMITDEDLRIQDRYRFMHAKYLIVDGHVAVVSTENFSPDSFPDDDKSDGTRGRRGVLLMLAAPAVAAHLEGVFADDLDEQHADVLRWNASHPVYGAPPPGYVPEPNAGGIGYAVRYPKPAVFLGTFATEIIQSPENSLRDSDSLLGLLNRAGQGDTLLVQQLSERPYWGATNSNEVADPNPRLAAYIAAARRGANVRLLLDGFFDDPFSAVSNWETCRRVNALARADALRLYCSLANPTGLGLHNKMVLARIGGQGYVHVGSLNGTELSHKGNREVAVQVQSNEAYAYLASLFERDTPHSAYLPAVMQGFRGPADHLVISEVYYDPPGLDDKEFIEIANPLPVPVSLAGYTIGDAVRPEDYEDVRVFPPQTVLGAGEALVVAFSATAFREEFGYDPDFEIVDSSAEVPDLIDETGWGEPEALLQLGNSGDEVILRRGLQAIDVVVYGDGVFGELVACPILAAPARTLERYPYWRDTDNCAADFRGWPFASPGILP